MAPSSGRRRSQRSAQNFNWLNDQKERASLWLNVRPELGRTLPRLLQHGPANNEPSRLSISTLPLPLRDLFLSSLFCIHVALSCAARGEHESAEQLRCKCSARRYGYFPRSIRFRVWSWSLATAHFNGRNRHPKEKGWSGSAAGKAITKGK